VVNGVSASVPCFRCGVCCAKYDVRVTLTEAQDIADELCCPWEEWLERYTNHSWPGSESFLLRHSGGACVFLEHVGGSNITRCIIQPFKPLACREWNSSLYHRDCQEGLIKYWRLTISPLGQLHGSDYDLERFHSFLESLALADKT
jgi:hypothetical protein